MYTNILVVFTWPGPLSCVYTVHVHEWEPLWLINWSIHYNILFSIEGHVALDRNPGPGYNILLLRMIPGACPYRKFHTLLGLLDSRAALSNSYPNCVPSRGQFVPFYGLWYDPATYRTWADMLTTTQTRRCGRLCKSQLISFSSYLESWPWSFIPVQGGGGQPIHTRPFFRQFQL